MRKTKAHRIKIEPFRWETDDPLAAEHALVSRLVSEILKSDWQYYTELDLSLTKTGNQVLDAEPETAANIVLALVAHTSYFDSLAQKVKALANSEIERMNWHQAPEWEAIWYPRQVSAQALRRLVRRKLPLRSEHLIRLADWISSAESQSDSLYPLKAFAKALQTYGKIGEDDIALRSSLSKVVRLFRNSRSKDLPKLAQEIETILSSTRNQVTALGEQLEKECQAIGPDPSQPTFVGSPHVLVQLKQFLKIVPEDNTTTVEIGFDRFPLRADSPLNEEHELINMFLPEVVGTAAYHDPASAKTPSWRAMLSRDSRGKRQLLLAAAERYAHTHFATARGLLEDYQFWQAQDAVRGLFTSLLSSKPELDRNATFDVLLFLTALSGYQATAHIEAAEMWFQKSETLHASAPLSPGERHVLHRLRCQVIRTCPFGRPDDLVARITRLLGDQPCLALVPGEAWSDTVNAELATLPTASRERWIELLKHAASSTGSRPSAKWLKVANKNIEALGGEEFSNKVLHWIPLVDAPRTIRRLSGGRLSGSEPSGTIHNDNALCLRGLVWMFPRVSSSDLIRAVGALTLSCYRKIPGVGPRAVKVGNAGVYALSQIDDPLALGQLALLKVKVKFGSAQKEIDKAFNAAAERSGLPREELEEMSVPTYGLTDVGIGEEQMGDFKARLTVTGTTSTELVWVKAEGKTQRAVPPGVKESHKEELKELQAAAKDIQKMLPAQRERIDGLFLQHKTWRFPV